MTEQGDSSRRSRRNVRLATLVLFIDNVGLGVLTPTLPFVVMSFHQPPSMVTGLVATYAGAGLVGGLLIGALSDRIGRRPTVIATLVGTVGAYVLALVWWSPLALFVGRGLAGAMTGRDAVLKAAVTDEVPIAQRPDAIATLTAAGSVGAAVGPSLVGVIALLTSDQLIQFRVSFICYIVMAAASLVTVLLFWKAAASSRTAGRPAAPPPRAFVLRQGLPLFMLNFVVAYGNGATLSVTALFVEQAYGWGAVATGAVVTVIGVTMAASRYWIVPWGTRRFGLKNLLLASLLGVAAGLSGAGMAPSAWIFVASLASTALFASVGFTILAALLSQAVAPEHRGFAFGVLGASATLGLVVAAIVNGWLFEQFWRGAPHVVAAAACLIALCFAAGVKMRTTSPV